MRAVSPLPFLPSPPRAVAIDAVPAIAIGDGCARRDLPSPPGARVWLIEMAPGSVWPRIERHDTGETYVVLSGEVIEGDVRHAAGTQVVFAPGSRHRPRSDTGARLFGFHLVADAFLGAGGDPSLLSGQLHVQQG